MAFNKTICKNHYSPNSDTGGLWTHIAFTVHAGVFIVFAGIVAPVIRFLLNNIPLADAPNEPQEEQLERTFTNDTSDLEVNQAQGVARHRLTGNSDLEISRTRDTPSIRSNHSGDVENTLGIGNNGRWRQIAPPRAVCHIVNAAISMYNSQSMVGLSYLIIGFVKIRDTDPYHATFIQDIGLLQLTLGIVTICVQNMVYDPTFNVRVSNAANIAVFYKRRSTIMFMLNAYVFIAYLITTEVLNRNDDIFKQCMGESAKNSEIGIRVALAVVSSGFVFHGANYKWPIVNFSIMIGLTALILAFTQSSLFRLARIFRPARIDGGSDETDFSYGQALVLFMLVPLLLEFGEAYLTDVKRIKRGAARRLEGEPTVTGLIKDYIRMRKPHWVHRLQARHRRHRSKPQEKSRYRSFFGKDNVVDIEALNPNVAGNSGQTSANTGNSAVALDTDQNSVQEEDTIDDAPQMVDPVILAPVVVDDEIRPLTKQENAVQEKPTTDSKQETSNDEKESTVSRKDKTDEK